MRRWEGEEMKINNIKALDYGYEGGKLWIRFTATQFEAVREVTTSQFDVVTDTGDAVETITGFQNIESIQYDAQKDIYTASFAPDIVDPEVERLRAENETLRERLDGLTAENTQFVERNIDLRADALVLQEGVSELSQSAPVEIMPVVQKLEGATAAVMDTLGLTEENAEAVK